MSLFPSFLTHASQPSCQPPLHGHGRYSSSLAVLTLDPLTFLCLLPPLSPHRVCFLPGPQASRLHSGLDA